MSDSPAVDIAAGLAHSLVAFDSPGFTPDVYYAGRDSRFVEKYAKQLSKIISIKDLLVCETIVFLRDANMAHFDKCDFWWFYHTTLML